MVRLDAFGSQVGLLVVIMRGAYLLESTVVYKYTRAGLLGKATSIQRIPTAGKNKKTPSPVKLAKVIIRTVAKNVRKRVSDGDYSLRGSL